MRAAFRGGRVPARLARSRRGRVDEIDGSVAQASQCCWPLTVTRYRYATRPPRRSRLYPSTDSGTIAKMDARSEPGLNDPFEEAIDDALSSLRADLRAAMSNVEIVVEDEPPDGQPLLGLYRGVPLPRRSSTYSGVLPDKISIYGGPITRLAAGDSLRSRTTTLVRSL